MKQHLLQGSSRLAANRRISRKRISLVYFLLFSFASISTTSRLNAQASVSNVSFTQFDRTDTDGKLLFANSSLAQISFTATPDASKIYYLNVYAKTKTQKDAWIVQNLPIEPPTDPVTTTCSATEIDLKLLEEIPGTRVSSISYATTVTASVVKATVVVAQTSSLKERISANQFSNLSTTPSPVPAAIAYTTVDVGKDELSNETAGWYNDWTDLALLAMQGAVAATNKDKDIPPVEEGPNDCVPGAYARSIAWLLNKNGLNPGKRTPQDIFDTLKKRFEGCNLSLSCMTERKKKYLDSITGGRGTTTKINPVPSPADTIKKYNDNCDVEVRFGPPASGGIGHIITIVSITCGTDGCCTIKYRDDDKQGKPGGDDCIKTTKICGDSIDFTGGKRKITDVIVECVSAAANRTPVSKLSPENNAELLQNVPNPFGNSTSIRIYVKDASLLRNAVLVISKENGNEVKRMGVKLSNGLNEFGYTPSKDLKGILYYSLEIDGKLVGSKKMFVQGN